MRDFKNILMGVDVHLEVRFGKRWLDSIRVVLRDNHDLVVTGTRHHSASRGFLMGSTGIKLLRLCPCPIWTTEPRKDKDAFDSQLVKYDFTQSPQVHILTDPPDIVVMQVIEKLDIVLLVMGTIARTGTAGIFTGNTAERLLPQIPCSVLAVNPPEFISPVSA